VVEVAIIIRFPVWVKADKKARIVAMDSAMWAEVRSGG